MIFITLQRGGVSKVKQTVDNDETVIEDEEEYLNSSQFSANESDDNEIEFANSNEDPVFPPETEPCPYEIAGNNNIAELGEALAQAQAKGEFQCHCLHTLHYSIFYQGS